MGIFAMATFITEQRTKEMGIRKTLGASKTHIVLLLTTDILKWVVLANVIAWPISLYISEWWLTGFAYRIEWTTAWLPALASFLSTLLIAGSIVSGQALLIAQKHSVDALRSE